MDANTTDETQGFASLRFYMSRWVVVDHAGMDVASYATRLVAQRHANRLNGEHTPTYRLTITLATGETHTVTVRKMPRHWKSHLMHSMPYGTSFQGATFTREAIS